MAEKKNGGRENVVPIRTPRQESIEDTIEWPSIVEAEVALLGAILVNNAAYHRVSAFLKPEHFFEPVHQRIYVAIERQIAEGRAANPVLLHQVLQADPVLASEQIGGAAKYLARLASAVITIINAEDYGVTILRCWRKREAIRACLEGIEASQKLDFDDTPDAVIGAVEEHFHLISEATPQVTSMPLAAGLVDAVATAERAYQGVGVLSGLSTGLTDLDKLLGGMFEGDLDVIAGRTSMGKTALAMSIALSVARARHHVLYWSGEMPRHQLAARVLAMDTGISTKRQRRGPLTAQDMDAIIEANERLGRLPLDIDDTVRISVGQLRSRAIRLKRAKGLELIVIDYLQLLIGGKAENRVQELSAITRDVKALAMELGVPVLALSQLSRAVENRDDKRPQLSDLRESGSIEQDADVVMFCYREHYYLEQQEPKRTMPTSLPDTKFDEAWARWSARSEEMRNMGEVFIRKNRQGQTGAATLHWDGERMRFGNLADIHDDRLI